MTRVVVVELLAPLLFLALGQQPAPVPKPPSGGGPEDASAFLYWLMNQPVKKRRPKKKALPEKDRDLLRMLQGLDAIRTLRLARQQAGISQVTLQ